MITLLNPSKPLNPVHPVGVICDWMKGVHRYKEPVQPWEAGRTLKIDRDGAIEWETQDWDTIRCPSSDTSLRIKCDGQKLYFSGNIGRFQRSGNLYGLTVAQCIDKWAEVLRNLGFQLMGFGSLFAEDTPSEWGTRLTRIDLAGNYDVSDFAAWCRALLLRPIGRKHPVPGKFGPTWGYDSKRAQWWKFKVYDKDAEQAGERKPRSGRTRARGEVQLGSQWLKREGLHKVKAWTQEGEDMGKVIYGRFAADLFREPPSVEDWSELPPRLRQYAILWRDGTDIRTLFAHDSSYCRIKSKLKEHGIDIGVPCNVTALVHRSRVVEVRPLDALYSVFAA